MKLNTCHEGTWCGTPYDFDIELKNDNILSNRSLNYGQIHFDNFGNAMLSVF